MRAAAAGLYALSLACAAGPTSRGAAPPPAEPPALRLRALGDRYWRALLATSTLPALGQGGIGTLGGPLYATSIGVHDFDARLDNLSTPARERLLDELRAIAAELRALPAAGLVEEDALSAALLAVQLDDAQQAEACRAHLWRVDPQNGPWAQVAQTALGYALDAAGAEALHARLSQVPRYFAQVEANLREGLSQGLVAARADVVRVLAQLDDLLAQGADGSPLLPAPDRFAAAPAGPAARARLRGLIGSAVLPAAARLRAFLGGELLEGARSDERVGLWALPGGAACYAALVRQHTTLQRTPEELHRLGLQQVQLIEAEAEATALQAGAPRQADGHVDLGAFRAQLQRRPAQFKRSADELLAFDRALLERATAALPRAFAGLSLGPLELRPFEAYRAPSSPAGFYEPAPDDGSAPGIFYVNTDRPETRTLYNAEALLFHEAVPGHHLEGSTTQRLPIPSWRRQLGPTAFVEGWALYAERMSDEELHLYSGPEARLGMLGYQAWRAARLVVDTGMHALRWDRERCIRFLTDHTTLPRNEAESEIDRYAAMPGQALGYMVGALEIARLRREARAALGPAFDLARFHRALLEHGPVTLPLLGRQVDAWVAAGGR